MVAIERDFTPFVVPDEIDKEAFRDKTGERKNRDQRLRMDYILLRRDSYHCDLCGCWKYDGIPLKLVVDHINGNNLDDRIENLRLVCPNCDSQLDTNSARNKGKNSAGVKVDNKHTTKNYTKDNKCIDCGTLITNNSQKCPKCANISSRKYVRPTREELKKLIRNKTFREIADELEVDSRRTISYWCETYGLPTSNKDILSYSDAEWELL